MSLPWQFKEQREENYSYFRTSCGVGRDMAAPHPAPPNSHCPGSDYSHAHNGKREQGMIKYPNKEGRIENMPATPRLVE